MVINTIPIINFATVCFLSATIVAGLTIYHKIKYRWPIKVSCWFCNSPKNVYKKESSWWFCSSCEQYNGFSPDGDYRYSIPEQSFINNSKNYSISQKTKLSDYQNGLCETCNHNEEFKLIELRKFENSQKRYSDYDLKKFRQECDEKYPLCTVCKYVVKSSLYKQSLWLAERRIIFLQKSMKNFVNNGKLAEKISKTILFSVIIAMNQETFRWLFFIIGIIVQFLLTLIHFSKKQLSLNLMLIMLWITIGALLVLPEISLLPNDLPFFFVNHITTKHMVLLFQLIFAFEILNIKLISFGVKRDVSFKKVVSCNKHLLQPSKLKVDAKSNAKKNSNNTNEKSTYLCHSPVNITDQLSTTAALKTPIPIKFKNMKNKQLPPGTPLIMPKFQEVETFSYNDIGYSMKTLSSLSLNDLSDSMSLRQGNVFSTKKYGTTSPDIFQKRPSRKIVLAPSKLRVSSPLPSWSVSNFLQEDLEMFSLSRSSSQSSGFASNSGEPSRENSIIDVDRYSVVSDVMSCCHHKHHCESIMNCSRSKKEFVKRESTVPCSSNFYSEKSCQSDGVSNDKTSVATIVTSPIWLSVLLCGSFIFNMVVLCVVLQR